MHSAHQHQRLSFLRGLIKDRQAPRLFCGEMRTRARKRPTLLPRLAVTAFVALFFFPGFPSLSASAQDPPSEAKAPLPKEAAQSVNREKTKENDFEKIIARVQKAYNELETLRAHFEQTTHLPSLGRPRVDTGSMELARGGRMRWDFETPEVRHFISDGKTLWIYYPEQNQVMTTDLAAQASRTALNFMFGLGDLRKDFIPSPLQDATQQIPGLDALVLKPKEEIPTLKRLTLYTSPEDGLVRRARIQDYMAGTTEIVFSDLQVNIAIEDARFHFIPPPGVDKLDAPGL